VFRVDLPPQLVYFLYRAGSGASVEFEFDEAKSRANAVKHGLDFLAAQALWLDELRIEVPARTEDESRFLVIGQIAGKYYSAVITYREQRFGSSRYDDPGKKRWPSMKAEEFDRKFDAGDDVTDVLDLSAARRPGQEVRRVNVDFPAWMVESLDREAKRLGVTRQSVIRYGSLRSSSGRRRSR